MSKISNFTTEVDFRLLRLSSSTVRRESHWDCVIAIEKYVNTLFYERRCNLNLGYNMLPKDLVLGCIGFHKFFHEALKLGIIYD